MQRLLPTLLLLSSTLLTQAQSLVTALIQHGNDSQLTTSITADPDNNMVAAVNFWDDLDANPGAPVVNFNSAGTMDVAIIKLDPDGNYIWGKQLSGAGFNQSSDIACDANGNIFIFGYYNGTMDMNPGPGVSNITSAGSDDIFVGKYDTDGNLLWAYSIGGTGTEQNYGFDVDNAGNAVLYGYFQNTVDFNPGAGTFNLTAGVGGSDFVLKLNNDGTFNFAVAMGSAYGNELKTDADNNIYCTGLFWNTVDFDPGPGTFNLTAAGFTNDSYIQKLSPTGGFLWAGKFSSSLADQGTSIGIDNINDVIYVGGFFEGTLDADPGVGTANLVSAGYVDSYIIKLNAATGNYIWGKLIGGLGWQALATMEVSPSGLVAVGGSFDQTADFDPGAGVFNLTTAGSTDIFKAGYNSDGTFNFAERFGNTGQDQAICINFDITGALLMTGSFDGIVDFDAGAGVFNLNSAFTGWDGFIAKYCTVYTINNNVNICAGDSYFAAGAWQTEPGDYYDYFTPVEGCDSIVITHLTVGNPTVNLGADVAICSGATYTLNAGNPGATYLWSTGATTQTITINTAGTYSVTVTDASGCIGTDAVVVSVAPSPVVDLGPNQTICEGTVTILNAGNPGASYLWNTGATTQTISVGTSGNYNVTVTNGFGCTDNDLIHITVADNPDALLPETIGICTGSATILDAGNTGADFVWNTAATTQTITVDAAGWYVVDIINADGCAIADSTLVTAFPLPDVELGADIAFCAGGTATLDATILGGSYVWNTGATSGAITVNTTGTYAVTVTDDNGCINADTISITVYDLPVVDLGADITTCQDTVIVLDAFNPGSTYDWNTGESIYFINVIESGVYDVTVTNAFSCSNADTIDITLHPLPVSEMDLFYTSCENVPVYLDATVPACTYLWNTGATDAAIWADTAGTYAVLITNSFGCQFSDTAIVDMLDAPDAAISLPEEICLDAAALTLTGGTPDGGLYAGDGITDGIFDPELAGVGTHAIQYIYTDVNGCSDTATATITVTICQAIDGAAIPNILLYPNPAMSNVTITTDADWIGAVMEITNTAGQLIHTETINNTIQNIAVSDWPSGLYIITVHTIDQMYRKQLMVTR